MYFIVKVHHTQYLLDATRLAALVAALDGAQQIDTKHVGDNLGTSGFGNSYIDLLTCKPLRDILPAQLMPESEYNALKLITESQKSA